MERQDIQMGLANQNMIGSSLQKADTAKLATAMHQMALAKNIKLMEGTLSVWDKLVAEDIVSGNFELEDVLNAISICIRMPMFNRIDYADCFKEAKDLFKKRIERMNNPRMERPGQGVPMPEDVRAILKRL